MCGHAWSYWTERHSRGWLCGYGAAPSCTWSPASGSGLILTDCWPAAMGLSVGSNGWHMHRIWTHPCPSMPRRASAWASCRPRCGSTRRAWPDGPRACWTGCWRGVWRWRRLKVSPPLPIRACARTTGGARQRCSTAPAAGRARMRPRQPKPLAWPPPPACGNTWGHLHPRLPSAAPRKDACACRGDRPRISTTCSGAERPAGTSTRHVRCQSCCWLGCWNGHSVPRRNGDWTPIRYS